MPIPNPTLDDKPYQEIVEEAKRKIQVYSKTWTDHNVSDPGITFIELFAWFAETQIYSLNKISEKNYYKFLKLLGVNPSIKPAVPAKLTLTFGSKNLDDSVQISKGTLLKQLDADTNANIVFDTDEDLWIVPLEIYKIAVFSRRGYEDVTDKIVDDNSGYFYPFTDSPLPGISSFYFGLDKLTAKNMDDLSSDLITVSIYLYEDDLPPVPRHGLEKPKIYLSNIVKWEYLGSKEGVSVPSALEWMPLELKEDTTLALTASGHITFESPFKDTDKHKILELISNDPETSSAPNKELYWIRCRLIENHYEIVPRIQNLLLNSISATFGRIVEEHYYSNGLPGQVLEFNESYKPAIEILEVKTIDPIDNAETLWKEVEDFDASTPDDSHYVCSLSNGSIFLGDGVNGKIAKLGHMFSVKYRFGNVEEEGHVIAGTQFKIVSGPNLDAITHFPSNRGENRETVKFAFARARSELKIPFKAVTSDDFEYLAINTPGLRVSRAKAFASKLEENLVVVILVPFSFDDTPKPSKGFLNTVCHHLDRHRLITTRLQVMEPEYVGINVSASITIQSNSNQEDVEKKIGLTLHNFLSPIRRRPEENAWPFGRDVYRSEVYHILESVTGVECVSELDLSGSGKPGSFETKGGNVLIKNFSLVYLKRYSINVNPSTGECRMEVSKDNK